MSFLGYNSAYKKNGARDGLPATVWRQPGERDLVFVAHMTLERALSYSEIDLFMSWGNPWKHRRVGFLSMINPSMSETKGLLGSGFQRFQSVAETPFPQACPEAVTLRGLQCSNVPSWVQ